MEGHFWMKRGENLCGISDCASFPIVPTDVNDDGDDDHSFKNAAAAVMASSVTENDKTMMTTTASALRRGRKD
jgi:hypothetical protein